MNEIRKREKFKDLKFKALLTFLKDNPKINPKDIKSRDYRLEWICEHGIGHTIWACNDDELDIHSDYVHGCDGCCRHLVIDEISKKYEKNDDVSKT